MDLNLETVVSARKQFNAIVSHEILRLYDAWVRHVCAEKESNPTSLLLCGIAHNSVVSISYRLFSMLSAIIDNPFIPDCYTLLTQVKQHRFTLTGDVCKNASLLRNANISDRELWLISQTSNEFPMAIFYAIMLLFQDMAVVYDDFELANKSLLDVVRTITFLKAIRDTIMRTRCRSDYHIEQNMSILEIGSGPWCILTLWAYLYCTYNNIQAIPSKIFAVELDANACIIANAFLRHLGIHAANFMVKQGDGTNPSCLQQKCGLCFGTQPIRMIIAETVSIAGHAEPIMPVAHAVYNAGLLSSMTSMIPEQMSISFALVSTEDFLCLTPSQNKCLIMQDGYYVLINQPSADKVLAGATVSLSFKQPVGNSIEVLFTIPNNQMGYHLLVCTSLCVAPDHILIPNASSITPVAALSNVPQVDQSAHNDWHYPVGVHNPVDGHDMPVISPLLFTGPAQIVYAFGGNQIQIIRSCPREASSSPQESCAALTARVT